MLNRRERHVSLFRDILGKYSFAKISKLPKERNISKSNSEEIKKTTNIRDNATVIKSSRMNFNLQILFFFHKGVPYIIISIHHYHQFLFTVHQSKSKSCP
jgi:hypothetical protein